MSVDTLSTANKSDVIIPTDSNMNPISDESNPAYLAGALYEAGKFYVRSGHFMNLLQYRAVNYGKTTTVASEISAFFVSQVASPAAYDFDNPCPDDATRVTAYDVGKTAGVDDFATVTAAMTVPASIYINRLSCIQEDLNFCNSLLSIVGDKRMREKLREDSRNSGLALIGLLKTRAANVKPGEKTLATTEFSNFANATFIGELNLASFDKWYEEYEKLNRRVPPANRASALDTIGTIDAIMFGDTDNREMYAITLKVDAPAAGDLDARLQCVREMLQSRLTNLRIDAARTAKHGRAGAGSGGGSESMASLVSDLAAKGYSKKQIVAVVNAMNGPVKDPVKDLKTPSGGWVKAPRDADGRVTHWIDGMEPCPCKVGGGKHLRRDRSAGCTLADNGERAKSPGRGKSPSRERSGDKKQVSFDTGATQESKVAEFLNTAHANAPTGSRTGGSDPKISAQLNAFFNSRSNVVDLSQSARVSETLSDGGSLAPTFPPSSIANSNPSEANARSRDRRFVAFALVFAVLIGCLGVVFGLAVASSAPSVSVVPSDVPSSVGPRGALDGPSTPAVVPGDQLALAIHDPGARVATPAAVSSSAWIWLRYLAVVLLIASVVGPASSLADTVESATHFWRELITVVGYIGWAPLGTMFPRTSGVLIRAEMVASRAARAANALRREWPRTVSVLLAVSASAFSTGAWLARRDAVDLGPLANVTAASCSLDAVQLDVPLVGRSASFDVSFAGSPQVALNTTAAIQDQLTAKGGGVLPVVCMTTDSGASASSTDDCRRLVNCKPCDEVFGSASGSVAQASCQGDMPMLVKLTNGSVGRVVFTNVRCVPEFKYTLLSVMQIWREQRIDARFRDLLHLQLPPSADNQTVPFDPSFRLPTVVGVSEAALYTCPEVSGESSPSAAAPAAQSSPQSSLVGFHEPSSTAHVARMSAAQAGELIHRRSHLGNGKIKALFNVTSDATKNLTHAPKCTCVFCAQSRITKASHSSTLDASDHEPGIIHTDLKGPFAASIRGYKYAMFFVDEYSRYIFVEFLKSKDEAMAATERVLARFNSRVGVPLDEDGKPGARPSVRRLHRDHEGKLESHAFDTFRGQRRLDTSASPPHDHNLNPIAERAIRTIDEAATAMFAFSGASVGFWDDHVNHAVNWHNVSSSSIGTSVADAQLSPHQRFTLKQPSCMELCTIGARTVVLKPDPVRNKGTLSNRGWVGCFCGLSRTSIGCFTVWVPSEGKYVDSSSIQVDEEYFPWRGADAAQPLTPSTRVPRQPIPEALGGGGDNDDANDTTLRRVPTSLLNLFSGPYHRTNGLAERATSFGWRKIEQIDNDAEVGGGWQHDLLNDSSYTDLKQRCAAGDFDAMVVAFPCSTFSISRLFNATADGHDEGPPPVRDNLHPDGLPLSQIPANHHQELARANLLLDRTVELIVAARSSSAKSTIILENPADRTVKGSNQYDKAFARHGSLFATSAFASALTAIGLVKNKGSVAPGPWKGGQTFS